MEISNIFSDCSVREQRSKQPMIIWDSLSVLSELMNGVVPTYRKWCDVCEPADPITLKKLVIYFYSLHLLITWKNCVGAGEAKKAPLLSGKWYLAMGYFMQVTLASDDLWPANILLEWRVSVSYYRHRGKINLNGNVAFLYIRWVQFHNTIAIWCMHVHWRLHLK